MEKTKNATFEAKVLISVDGVDHVDLKDMKSYLANAVILDVDTEDCDEELPDGADFGGITINWDTLKQVK